MYGFALGIHSDGNGHVLYNKFMNGFHAKIRKCNDA